VFPLQLVEAFLLKFVHDRLFENALRLDGRQGLHRMNGVFLPRSGFVQQVAQVRSGPVGPPPDALKRAAKLRR